MDDVARFITSWCNPFGFLTEKEGERERERKARFFVTWRFCCTMYLTYCSQDREEQGGGEGQARASATAGAAAARSATRSARLRRFRVGDSTCTCDSGRSSRCHRTQRLQHQWHPGHPGASSGSQWQQHQEETQRWRWVTRESPRSCRWPQFLLRSYILLRTLRHRAILFNTEYVYYRQRDRLKDVQLQLNLQKSQTARYESIAWRNEMLLISRV